MVWYSHLFQNFPQFFVIHTVKGFGIVNKAEIDVFLGLSCFFHDPADGGNLISGSSAFSKTSFNIWKFTVHVLLNPDLDAYSAPAEIAAAGEDLGTETPGADDSAAGGFRTVAVRKTGAPDEKVRIHMTMQVLYFTPGKTK